MTGVFKQFFSAIDGVVGNEANYQAAMAHYLNGRFDSPVLREFVDKRAGRGGIDVAVTSASGNELTHAFEIKGGAYGNRNALRDTFDSTGYCKDFDKLARLDDPSCQCWMIAVDALELGRGMSAKALQGAVQHARERKMGLAYYALGEETAELILIDGQAVRIPVIQNMNQFIPYKAVRPTLTERPLLAALFATSGDGYAKEADIVGALYSGLLDKRCSAKQMSLETYFGFAPGSRMQQRPDLCVYEPTINGRFNLYPHGDRKKSNDVPKLENIRAFIEVKGSKTLASKRDDTLMKIYLGDLEKIALWKVVITGAAKEHGVRVNCDYLFIAIDHRTKPLSEDGLAVLLKSAQQQGIIAHYLHCPAR